MSEVIEDLVSRIASLEDKENMEEEKSKRKTRANATTDPATAEKCSSSQNAKSVRRKAGRSGKHCGPTKRRFYPTHE
jgi:hypothetical protein